MIGQLCAYAPTSNDYYEESNSWVPMSMLCYNTKKSQLCSLLQQSHKKIEMWMQCKQSPIIMTKPHNAWATELLTTVPTNCKIWQALALKQGFEQNTKTMNDRATTYPADQVDACFVMGCHTVLLLVWLSNMLADNSHKNKNAPAL